MAISWLSDIGLLLLALVPIQRSTKIPTIAVNIRIEVIIGSNPPSFQTQTIDIMFADINIRKLKYTITFFIIFRITSDI